MIPKSNFLKALLGLSERGGRPHTRQANIWTKSRKWCFLGEELEEAHG